MEDVAQIEMGFEDLRFERDSALVQRLGLGNLVA